MSKEIFNRLTSKNCVLFVCDLEDKFRPRIAKFDAVVEVAARLVKTAEILEIPIIATKGESELVEELGLPERTHTFKKEQFSMWIPEVEAKLRKEHKSVILCGIEAHACVQQTAFDLLEKEIGVHVVVDATSARSAIDRAFAFKQMERAGAILTTSECVILELCRGTNHPKFDQIQEVIWDSAPDTELNLASM